jgi:hypothetical protein
MHGEYPGVHLRAGAPVAWVALADTEPAPPTHSAIPIAAATIALLVFNILPLFSTLIALLRVTRNGKVVSAPQDDGSAILLNPWRRRVTPTDRRLETSTRTTGNNLFTSNVASLLLDSDRPDRSTHRAFGSCGLREHLHDPPRENAMPGFVANPYGKCMNSIPRGYAVGMQETPESKRERDNLWAETLWSIGLVAVVAAIIVLLSMIGPR